VFVHRGQGRGGAAPVQVRRSVRRVELQDWRATGRHRHADPSEAAAPPLQQGASYRTDSSGGLRGRVRVLSTGPRRRRHAVRKAPEATFVPVVRRSTVAVMDEVSDSFRRVLSCFLWSMTRARAILHNREWLQRASPIRSRLYECFRLRSRRHYDLDICDEGTNDIILSDNDKCIFVIYQTTLPPQRRRRRRRIRSALR